MKTIERPIRAEQCLLLLVDEQENLLKLPSITIEEKDFRKKLSALVQVANAYQIPTVISTIALGGELIAEVKEHIGAGVPHFERETTNPLEHPATAEAIESTGRTTLLVAGVVTEIAALMPALTGKIAGYDTALVYDACGGASARSEFAAVQQLSQAGVIIFSVAQLIGELVTEFSSDASKLALSLLQA